MNPTANSVSRCLRRGGMLPIPRHQRDGISVSRGFKPGIVTVQASIVGQARREQEMLSAAAQILAAAGYSCERFGAVMYVTVKEADDGGQ